MFIVDQAYFIAHIGRYTAKQVVNVEESAWDDKVRERKYGQALAGKRASISAIFVRGKRITIEMGISSTGIVGYQRYEGSMDGEDFMTYLAFLVFTA